MNFPKLNGEETSRFISKIYISDRVNDTGELESYFENYRTENINFSPFSVALVKLSEPKNYIRRGINLILKNITLKILNIF